MKRIIHVIILFSFTSLLSLGANAENQWSAYRGSPVPPKHHVPPPPPNHGKPGYPPIQPYPPYHVPHVQVNIAGETNIQHNVNQYTWVNGDPAVAQITSSTYVVISDWQRLGLPAPPEGMYWIYENGRYVLVNQ